MTTLEEYEKIEAERADKMRGSDCPICLEKYEAYRASGLDLDAVLEQNETLHKRIGELERELAILETEKHASALANTRDIFRGEKIVELNIEQEARIAELEKALSEANQAKLHLFEQGCNVSAERDAALERLKELEASK